MSYLLYLFPVKHDKQSNRFTIYIVYLRPVDNAIMPNFSSHDKIRNPFLVLSLSLCV